MCDADELKSVQKELEKYILDYAKCFCGCWDGYLDNTNLLQTAYVDLKLIFMDYNQVLPGNKIKNYQSLFEDDIKQKPRQTVIISGEPGCGKSMYVHKLAFDWANGDDYLRDKFDMVLLFDKYLLKTTIQDGLRQFISSEFQCFIDHHIEKSAKVLMIFDGLNDINENEEIYNEIQSIIEHKMYPMATVVVTTRHSNLWDMHYIESNCEYVWMDGFDDSGVGQFIRIQKCKENSNESISDLLHVPIFCALYCSLQSKEDGSTALATDSFDMIKCFVDKEIKNYFENSGKANTKNATHDYMMLVGKYSLIHLVNNPGLDELRDLKLTVVQNSLDCASLNESNFQLNFFMKKQIPSGVALKFKEEVNVVHQIVAEYLSAYYVANILNVDLHMALLPGVWHKTPLLEYVLFNILLLWEEGKFSTKNVDAFLTNGETCLLWYSKRPLLFETLVEKTDAIETLSWENPIVGRMMTCISNFIRCRNLKRLVLHCCYIRSHSTQLLANDMSQIGFPNLAEICINEDINIGQEAGFFKALAKCENLRYLQMPNCNISSDSIKAFAREMKGNNFLNLEQIIFISNAEIGKEVEFFSSLIHCPKLFQIQLSRCGITAESLHAFTKGIQSNGFPHLQWLDFSYSKDIGSEVEFFSSLGKLEKIDDISLTDCNITSASLQAFAAQIRLNNLKNLIRLDIAMNGNIGCEISLISALAEKLPQLESLVIYGCNLTTDSKSSLNTLRSRDCQVCDTKIDEVI